MIKIISRYKTFSYILNYLLVAHFLYGKENTLNTSAHLSFDHYEVLIGNEDVQIILTGDISSDDHKEIAVVSGDSLGVRLSVFSYSNDLWKETFNTDLPDNIAFFDIAKIQGTETFIYYLEGKFYALNLKDNTIHQFLSFDFGYNEKSGHHIPRVNLTWDLNGDGLDEFIIPRVDGFTLFIQNKDGTFAEPIDMGPPEPFQDISSFDDDRTYGEVGPNAQTVPWLLSRVHLYDHNLDGMKDLVFWNEDHFDVYLQNSMSSFESDPVSFSTDVPFDSDGTYSFLFNFSDKTMFSLMTGIGPKSDVTILHSIRDMNNDGIADLVTHQLWGRSVFRMKSRYHLYYGASTPKGIEFIVEEGSSASPEGIRGGMESGGYAGQWLEDFNGDGNVDILRYDGQVGLKGFFQVLIARFLLMDLEFFSMENGQFSNVSNEKLTIKSEETDGSEDISFFPALMVGDVNGDQITDLVIGKDGNKLNIYYGDPSNKMLSNPPQTISVTLPRRESDIWMDDLNNDGRKDIVMYYLIKNKIKTIISNKNTN